MGAFSTAHCAQPCIHTWGMHDVHSVTPQKVIYSQFYISFRLHRQIKCNLVNIFKIKTPHLLSLTKSSILDSTTVEGQHTELLMYSQGIYLL